MSGGNPIGPYLEAMAVLAAAQHEIAQTLAVPAPDPRDIELALAHGMPPLTAAGGQDHWRGALAGLLSRLDRARLPCRRRHGRRWRASARCRRASWKTVSRACWPDATTASTPPSRPS